MTARPFAPHFTRAELNPHGSYLTPGVVDNLCALSWLLESVRAALGDKALVITSGYRAAAVNAATAGASTTSQHLDGTAADFRLPAGVSAATAATALDYAAQRDASLRWGQLILYPFSDNHAHISLPTRTQRQLVQIERAGTYETATGAVLAQLPGALTGGALAIAGAAVAIAAANLSG